MKNRICYSLLFLGYILVTSSTINAQNSEEFTSWEVLAKVTWAIDHDRGIYSPEFDQEIENLDGEEVTIKGYLFPLGFGPESSEFLFTPYPVNGCFYCVPGSTETMIYLPEAKLKNVPFTEVSMKGKFQIIRDNPYGLIYEMEDVNIEESN